MRPPCCSIRRKGRRLIAIATFFMVCLALQFHPTHAFSVENQQQQQQQYDPNMKTKIASSVAKTERRELERSRVGREICTRCIRPPELCVCESLPEKLVETSTSVLILQHPNERRRKSLSTVPLMPLCLEKCTVKVGYGFEVGQLDIVTECIERGQKPLLLFPGKDAISLDDDSNSDAVQNLKDKDQLLILIDGTWSEARGVHFRSLELMNICQQVQFQSDSESIYPEELRKEPQSHCISTLESCAHALTLLEPPERALEAKKYLEGSMRCMVGKRMSVSESRNRAPRFARAEKKIYAKNKRRHEIKQDLFSSRTWILFWIELNRNKIVISFFSIVYYFSTRGRVSLT